MFVRDIPTPARSTAMCVSGNNKKPNYLDMGENIGDKCLRGSVSSRHDGDSLRTWYPYGMHIANVGMVHVAFWIEGGTRCEAWEEV